MLSKGWFSDKDEATKGEHTLDSPQDGKESERKKKENIGIPETSNYVNNESKKCNENNENSFYYFS